MASAILPVRAAPLCAAPLASQTARPCPSLLHCSLQAFFCFLHILFFFWFGSFQGRLPKKSSCLQQGLGGGHASPRWPSLAPIAVAAARRTVQRRRTLRRVLQPFAIEPRRPELIHCQWLFQHRPANKRGRCPVVSILAKYKMGTVFYPLSRPFLKAVLMPLAMT